MELAAARRAFVGRFTLLAITFATRPLMTNQTSGPATAARWLSPETLIQSLGIGLMMTIMSRLTALGRAVVFARVMDRSELGIWSITHGTIQLAALVLVLGIPGGLNRYVVRYQREGRLRSFLTQAAAIALGIGVAACLAGVVLRVPLARLIYDDPSRSALVVAACLAMFTLVAINMLQGVLQGLRVYRINAMMLFAQSVGFAALASLMLTFWQPTALAGAWAFFAVSNLVVIAPAWLVWQHVRCEPYEAGKTVSASTWRQILLYSFGAWAGGSMADAWSVLDRYMLIHCDTLAAAERLQQVGTYHIVENVTGPLLALAAGWAIQVLANAADLWESHRRREAEQLIGLAVKLTLIVFTFAAAGLAVLKPLVLARIFGDTSMASGAILEIVLASTILLSGQCMLRAYLFCRERSLVIALVWVGVLATSLVLNWLLIPVFHLKGAALAALVGASVSAAILLATTARAGLPLTRSLCAVWVLPFVLLLPPYYMLAALAVVALLVSRTDWLLAHDDKDKMNGWLAERLARQPLSKGMAVG
jgi:O-antigen/teichoic acid export membrane protein